MAKIKVFNNGTGKMETYYKGENEAMPYNINVTLKVKEFRGSSNSDTLWTSKAAMEAWNAQRTRYGKPIPVGYDASGMQPRDPGRPWRGSSASGHKPR